MSDKQFANETVKVVEMTTEIDKAGAHQFSKARREDGVGGVVTEPDGDICFMGGLRSDIYYNINTPQLYPPLETGEGNYWN